MSLYVYVISDPQEFIFLCLKVKSHGAEKSCGIENASLEQPISAIRNNAE